MNIENSLHWNKQGVTFSRNNLSNSAKYDKLSYKQPFLHSNDGSPLKSSQFLKEISYRVNLSDLYKVVNSCYLNQQMQYCPILVQINHEILKKDYGCEYLLQVWDQNGAKVVSIWSVNNELLVYKPQLGDENFDCYHIVNFKNGNATLLIKDCVNDQSSNSTSLYLLQLDLQLDHGQKKKIELQKLQIQKIVPGVNIHGIFNIISEVPIIQAIGSESCKSKVSEKQCKVIIALETQDNQLDFSEIVAKNLGNEKFQFVFNQQRESASRKINFDMIQKFSFVVDLNNVFYGISLRKSGQFDIYWDMVLIDSPFSQTSDNYESKNDLHKQLNIGTDVIASFDSLYVKMKNGNVRSLRCIGSLTNFGSSKVESEEFYFDIVFYQNIKNHTHGRYISLYNIQDSEWTKHVKFEEAEIHKIFKKSTKTSKEEKDLEKPEVTVILQTGSIYDNMNDFIFNRSKQQINLDEIESMHEGLRRKALLTKQKEMITTVKIINVEASMRNYQLPGRLIKSSYDQQHNLWIYLMTKDFESKKVRWFAFYDGVPLELGAGFKDRKMDETSSLVHLSDPAFDESYIVVQNKTRVSMYQISLSEEMISINELDSNIADVKPNKLVQLNLIMRETVKKMEGQIHSAFSLDPKDHVFFFDKKHLYYYQWSKKQLQVYKNQNSEGICMVDDNFCYTLNHISGSKNSGLRMYDAKNIQQKKTDLSFHLKNLMVGVYSKIIDWNSDYSRLTLIQNLDELVILPALHRNSIAFIGMGKREDYIATKVIQDKFIALNSSGYIFTWSNVTGKLTSVNKLPTRQDYSNFEIFYNNYGGEDDKTYKREWYSKVLIVCKEAEENYNEKRFYSNDKLNTSPMGIQNQVSYAEQQEKEFREFRLIEIISENKVVEHLIFVHPLYSNQKQRLYFDNKLQFMLEKLNHPRVFLYQRDKQSIQSKVVSWSCLRRFNSYPWELDTSIGYLSPMSPSFLFFIDLQKTQNQFVIRDTLTLKEIYQIPNDIMDAMNTKGGIEQVMNKFVWINDEKIKIINNEGVEKIVDLSNKCQEIEFNVTPLFNNKELSEPQRHFYVNRNPVSLSDVLGRLKRKYQAYKSQYYLQKNTESHQFYSELFTVDYSINNYNGLFVADLSFTYLHWKMIEQLECGNLNIDLIEDTQIELMCYNILPNGQTLLHEMHEHSDIISKIFKIAHPNDDNVKEIKIHIPFLQNFNGLSPMHICKQKQDLRVIETLLTYLAGYEYDHHSKAITDLYPFFIEKQLPSMLKYLDSRLQQPEKLKKIIKGSLRNQKVSIIDSQFWFSKADLEGRLIQSNKDEEIVERPIKIEIIDLPKLYHFDEPISEEFFKQLANTDQYKIFEKKVIKKIIEFNYNLVKEWTIKKLFIPFVLFQSTLFVYLNVIFENEHTIMKQLNFPTQILLGVFAIYFLRNEFQQIGRQGSEYLSSIWNYFDIITPIIILTILSINAMNIEFNAELERAMQAVGVFFMWFKFLYFFRIFKNFGYLTRLMILVIYDMRHFLVVLFFTIVAFGDSFLTLSNGNDPKDQFVSGFTDSIIYTYRIILGDFDVEQFGHTNQLLVLALFIICTVFNTIVMLNLLIAIISETFAVVKENAENASYQEMASMIAENTYLIPDKIKRNYAQKNRYLMIVTDLEGEIEGDQDEVAKKLEHIKRKVIKQFSITNKLIKGLTDKQAINDQWQEKMDQNINTLMIQMNYLTQNKGASNSDKIDSNNVSRNDIDQVFIQNPRSMQMKRETVRSTTIVDSPESKRNLQVRQ